MANGERSSRTVVAPSEELLTEDEICGAHTQNGTKCRMMKGQRTEHPGYGNCSKHGGNTEAGIKSAAREMGRDLIVRHKESNPQRYRFGGNRHDPSIASLSPEQALVEEVRRSAAMVRFLEERISHWGMDLTDPSLELFMSYPNGKKVREPHKRKAIDQFLASLDPENPDSSRHLPELITETKTGFSAFTNAREWLYLYREERGHLARVAKMALDAGVAQRLVSLAEDQGRILATALRVVLQALHLSEEQQAMIPLIVPPVLRAVAADQPIPDITTLLGTTQGQLVS